MCSEVRFEDSNFLNDAENVPRNAIYRNSREPPEQGRFKAKRSSETIHSDLKNLGNKRSLKYQRYALNVILRISRIREIAREDPKDILFSRNRVARLSPPETAGEPGGLRKSRVRVKNVRGGLAS